MSPKDVRAEVETELTESQPATRASRRWLLVAVLTTVFAVLFLGYSLSAVLRGVSPSARAAVSSTPSTDAEPLVMAIGRTPGGQAEWSNYVVLMRRIQERIGRPIKIRYIADREAAAEVFENGEADCGFLCTRSYVILADKGLVRAVAVPITSGATTETAMIFVRSDSSIRTFEELREHSIAISSKTSVSGAAYLYWLADQKGMSVESFFGAIEVSPTQEEGLRKLADGSVDAAVGCSTEARAYPAGTFRAVATSPQYALPPFVVSTNMDPELAAQIRDAILSFDARSSLPSDSVLSGFLPVSDADYAFSRELLRFVPDGGSK